MSTTLTDPQLSELKALSRCPQNTFGSARTRVQNTLVRLEFAAYVSDKCEITESGRHRIALANERPWDRRQQRGCRSDDDGHCTWADCPQIRDNEPHATGRHCPLDTSREDER